MHWVQKPATLEHGRLLARTVFPALLFCAITAVLAVTATAQSDERRVVRAVASNFAPFAVFEDGEATGYSVEILRELAGIASWDLTITQVDNPAEALKMMEAGEADLHPNLVRTPARERVADFTEPLGVMRVVAIIDPTRHDITRIDQATGYRMGYVRGAATGSMIPDDAPYIPVEIPTNAELQLRFLDGSIDGVISTRSAFLRQARQIGFEQRTAVLTPDLRSSSWGIAVAQGSVGLLEETEAALAELSTLPRFTEIREGWFGTNPERRNLWPLYALAIGSIVAALLAGVVLWHARSRAKSQQSWLLRRGVEQVLNAATNGIIGLSQDGVVQVINPAARHMLGGLNEPTPFDLPEDLTFLDAADLKPLAVEKTPVARALAGEHLHGETNLMARMNHRSHRYAKVTSASVENSEANIHTVLVIEDVSEQEVVRQQVERASRLDALGQLTGGIAHDFNNLLATIQYSVELALRHIKDQEATSLLEMALGSVNRGAALSRRLLAFARRQPGLAQSRDVDRIRDDFMALIKPTIEKTIDVEFTVERPDIWVYCDQGQLENALLNLVLNSRDAIIGSGEGNTIRISARALTDPVSNKPTVPVSSHAYRASALALERREDSQRQDNHAYRYVEFAVTDNGPGMTDEVKRRAVDPFFSTKDSTSGTGLGLSIVYGFVQQAGGELRLYSDIGKGTTVQLMLPRGTSEGRRESPVPREAAARGEGETILVVEDEIFLLDLMSQSLTSLGYEVSSTSSGDEAKALLDSGRRFDIILTDVVMPGELGGFELAAYARTVDPQVGIVYMSGYTGYSDNQMGGVIAPLLPKPCPESTLARTLKEVLGKSSVPQEVVD